MFHWLVGGAVFAYAEGVVRPDELHGHFHQRGHADGGFHIVGEDEERAARGDDTSMQCHADATAGHGQFGHAGLEESTAEVAFCEGVRLLQESVGLV